MAFRATVPAAGAYFALKAVQYPLGEITPSTILHVPVASAVVPGMKNAHFEHCLSPLGFV